jgi:hypothetical protein
MVRAGLARHHRPQSPVKEEDAMPILLWLLGMPIGLIILLLLLGGI